MRTITSKQGIIYEVHKQPCLGCLVASDVWDFLEEKDSKLLRPRKANEESLLYFVPLVYTRGHE